MSRSVWFSGREKWSSEAGWGGGGGRATLQLALPCFWVSCDPGVTHGEAAHVSCGRTAWLAGGTSPLRHKPLVWKEAFKFSPSFPLSFRLPTSFPDSAQEGRAAQACCVDKDGFTRLPVVWPQARGLTFLSSRVPSMWWHNHYLTGVWFCFLRRKK